MNPTNKSHIVIRDLSYFGSSASSTRAVYAQTQKTKFYKCQTDFPINYTVLR